MDKVYLTTQDAASRLGVTTARVRQLISSGRLAAHRWGRDWQIDARSVEAARHRPGRGRPRKTDVVNRSAAQVS